MLEPPALKRARSSTTSVNAQAEPAPTESPAIPVQDDTKKIKNQSGEEVQLEDDAELTAQTWEDLKELWENAMEAFEGPEPAASVPLLRGLIFECDRIVRNSPDPTRPLQPAKAADTSAKADESESVPQWETTIPSTLSVETTALSNHPEPLHPGHELSTFGFFHIYGTTLLTLAEVFTQEPRLADPSEPSPQVINAKSIDFFEKALQGCQGEYETEISSPVGSKGNAKKRMDWKLEIAWGRALVSLARQKLEDGDEEEEEMEELGKKKKPTKARGLMGNKKRAREPEPVVPPVAAKTPVYKLSPKQLLVHAADHFQLGILHMPRPFPSLFDPSEQYKDPITSLNSTINHRQRLRTLLDIASSVSPLAEKFTDPRERSKWAVWSNGIFDQVDTESPVRLQSAQGQDDDWKFEVALGRGGVWLGVGSRLVEDLEQGDEGEVDEKKKAEAREMVQRSLKFLAEARKMRPRASETALEGSAEGEKEDEVAPLLVEAYLTLSGLVGDEEEGEVERLEELAREEGWVEEDEEDDEDMSVDGDD